MTPRQIIYIYTLFYLLFFQLIRFLVYDLALLCHYILTFVLFLFFFWLRWIFVAVHGLSLVPASGGYSSLWCVGFSLQWLLLLQSMVSRHASFSSCGIWAQSLWLVGSREQAQQLRRVGLVALRNVGSSQMRARTRVPCIGRRILNH